MSSAESLFKYALVLVHVRTNLAFLPPSHNLNPPPARLIYCAMGGRHSKTSDRRDDYGQSRAAPPAPSTIIKDSPFSQSQSNQQSYAQPAHNQLQGSYPLRPSNLPLQGHPQSEPTTYQTKVDAVAQQLHAHGVESTPNVRVQRTNPPMPVPVTLPQPQAPLFIQRPSPPTSIASALAVFREFLSTKRDRSDTFLPLQGALESFAKTCNINEARCNSIRATSSCRLIYIRLLVYEGSSGRLH